MFWARMLALLTLANSAFAESEPPRYVPAIAHHILPETTSEESGYFSLSESLATRNGTHYATILYPFTLLKIDGYKVGRSRPATGVSP
jgi:hypothetical protein